jgi:uncharacterized coiled-coil DUF342 family protein
VESGQEKDKLIGRLQQYHATSRGTISDNNKLRDDIDQLRHQCNKKQGDNKNIIYLGTIDPYINRSQ